VSTDLDTTRIVRSWLRTDEHESAARILDDVLAMLDTTPQRRSWPARRIDQVNGIAKLAIAAAAVVAIAVVGINLMPRTGGDSAVGGSTPTPTAIATPTPTASPSAGAQLWPTGALEAGTYNATLRGVPFSFTLPSSGWNTVPTIPGNIEIRPETSPNGDSAWIDFMGTAEVVGTDPCAGLAAPVPQTAADVAAALARIPGTHAVGPTDVELGGLPAKLVVITISPDIPCAPTDFWLAGVASMYPDRLDSIVKNWIFDMDGKVRAIYSVQARPDPGLERQIQQIVDSIQFE
jgi:hypothetical protein